MSVSISSFLLYLSFVYLIRGTKSCDRTLFISSSNQICNDQDCETVVHSYFTLQVGSTVCLNHKDLTTTRIRIDELSILAYYKSLYFTCDYTPVVESVRHCFGAAGCWSDSYCTFEVLYHRTDGPWLGVSEKEVVLKREGCRGSQIACVSDRCGYWNTQSCVWLAWWLKEKECYQVLIKESESMRAQITVTTANQSQSYFISPGFPTLERPISLLLSSINLVDIPSLPNSILELSKGEVLDIEISSINQPVYGTLGEYQRSLDNKTRVFPTSAINCMAVGCESKCLFNEKSSVKRLVIDKIRNNTLPTSRLHNNIYINGSPVITKIASGSVAFLVETSNIDHLYVNTPDCQLSVAYVLACTGCKTPIRVGIVTTVLYTEGIFITSSNCSVNNQYLRCQSDPYEIEIKGTPTICAFWKTKNGRKIGLSQNRSSESERDNLSPTPLFIIPIKYEFEGSLDPITTLAIGGNPKNWMDGANLLLSNKNFQLSLLSISALTFSGVLALRLLMNIIAIREGKTLFDLTDKK